MINFDFFLQAAGIVFRESLEAVLIYGIIVSFFCRKERGGLELRAARWGLALGIVASILLGVGLVGVTPLISDETFSVVEIAVIFLGSLLMLYMVFWMQKHAKTMKRDLENDLSRAGSVGSVVATIFVAVFREGVETVVYLYSLSLQNTAVSHRASLFLSLVTGISLSFVIYRLLLMGSKRLSMKLVFRITGLWLLFSSSALLATGIDRLFALGKLESWSKTVYDWSPSDSLRGLSASIESLSGFRFEPSVAHLTAFIVFWLFVLMADPLEFRAQKVR